MSQPLKPREGDTGRTLGWKMLLESAKVALKKQEVEQAEQLFTRALGTAEKRLGPDDVIIAHILMEIAEFYLNQHEHARAYECYCRVRRILATRADDVPPALT